MATLTGHEQRVLSEASAFILEEDITIGDSIFNTMTKHTGSLLIDSITSSTTTFTISQNSFKSSVPFIIRIDDEAMYVTSLYKTAKEDQIEYWGASYTVEVERGYAGTEGIPHTTCSDVYLVVPDGSVGKLRGDIYDSVDITLSIISPSSKELILSLKRKKEYEAVCTYYFTKTEVG